MHCYSNARWGSHTTSRFCKSVTRLGTTENISQSGQVQTGSLLLLYSTLKQQLETVQRIKSINLPTVSLQAHLRGTTGPWALTLPILKLFPPMFALIHPNLRLSFAMNGQPHHSPFSSNPTVSTYSTQLVLDVA